MVLRRCRHLFLSGGIRVERGFVMPTFAKYVKALKREHRVNTADPREISELRARGYREVKPKPASKNNK